MSEAAIGAEVPPGWYAYRFDGFPMTRTQKDPHRLVGLGVLEVAADRSLRGVHHASTTRLAGADAQAWSARYVVSGSYVVLEPRLLEATVEFRSPQQVMEGKFVITAAGPGRFWLISTESYVHGSDPHVANEVVSGELVWTGAS